MIEVVKKSILEVAADVIVLSAHPTLIAGGGISGVIHRAAGPDLEAESRSLGPLRPGNAVITKGYDLSPARIIHAVAPRYLDGSERQIQELRDTYRAILRLNSEKAPYQSIALPAIGVGVYRWPIPLATRVAVEELTESKYEKTIVAVIDDENYFEYRSFLQIRGDLK